MKPDRTVNTRYKAQEVFFHRWPKTFVIIYIWWSDERAFAFTVCRRSHLFRFTGSECIKHRGRHGMYNAYMCHHWRWGTSVSYEHFRFRRDTPSERACSAWTERSAVGAAWSDDCWINKTNWEIVLSESHWKIRKCLGRAKLRSAVQPNRRIRSTWEQVFPPGNDINRILSGWYVNRSCLQRRLQ